MSIVFSGSELMEIALGIEENGAAFYQALADKTEQKGPRAIYEHLAEEERKHQETFQGMLDAVGKYQPPADLSQDYARYLKSLVDSSVFSSVSQAQQQAAQASSDRQALDIGIQAEKDSILFYTEMQSLVKPADRPLVLKIIDEEREHLDRLSQLKQTLAEAG